MRVDNLVSSVVWIPSHIASQLLQFASSKATTGGGEVTRASQMEVPPLFTKEKIKIPLVNCASQIASNLEDNKKGGERCRGK